MLHQQMQLLKHFRSCQVRCLTTSRKLGSFKYEGFTYNLEAGTVTLTKVELDDQSDVKTAIDALVGTGLFQEDVGYNGYSIGEDGSSGVTLDSLTLYLKEEGEGE